MKTNLFELLTQSQEQHSNTLDTPENNNDAGMEPLTITFLTVAGTIFLIYFIPFIKSCLYANRIDDEAFFADVFEHRNKWEEAIRLCPGYAVKIADKLTSSATIFKAHVGDFNDFMALTRIVPDFRMKGARCILAHSELFKIYIKSYIDVTDFYTKFNSLSNDIFMSISELDDESVKRIFPRLGAISSCLTGTACENLNRYFAEKLLSNEAFFMFYIQHPSQFNKVLSLFPYYANELINFASENDNISQTLRQNETSGFELSFLRRRRTVSPEDQSVAYRTHFNIQ